MKLTDEQWDDIIKNIEKFDFQYRKFLVGEEFDGYVANCKINEHSEVQLMFKREESFLFGLFKSPATIQFGFSGPKKILSPKESQSIFERIEVKNMRAWVEKRQKLQNDVDQFVKSASERTK